MPNAVSLSPEEFLVSLSPSSLDLVQEFYDPKAKFKDPVVELHGPDAIARYYERLFTNLREIRLDILSRLEADDEVVLFWQLHVRHPRIKRGKEVVIDGNSHFRFDPLTKKALYHRDYFDMGELVYDNLPIVGKVANLAKGLILGRIQRIDRRGRAGKPTKSVMN